MVTYRLTTPPSVTMVIYTFTPSDPFPVATQIHSLTFDLGYQGIERREGVRDPRLILTFFENIRLCKKFVRRVKGVSGGIIILTRRTNFLHNLVYVSSTKICAKRS